jgi:broad specificity phosphatase PhoE
MELFFVRHARSEANERDLLAGRKDYPLSPRGRADAEALAKAFVAERDIDAIIASPLSRARQTAEPFARLIGIEIETDEALVEQDMGIFTGKSYAEAEADPAYELDKARRWDWVPPGGGESYRMIAERIRPFFSRLDASRTEGKARSVLVVTHAVTLRLIIATLAASLPSYPLILTRNGEILEYAYEGTGRGRPIRSIYLGSDAEGKA